MRSLLLAALLLAACYPEPPVVPPDTITVTTAPETSIVVPDTPTEPDPLKGVCLDIDVVAAAHELGSRVVYSDPIFDSGAILNFDVSPIDDPHCPGKAARVEIYARQNSGWGPFVSCVIGGSCSYGFAGGGGPGPHVPGDNLVWSCIRDGKIHNAQTSKGPVCLMARLESNQVVIVSQQPIPCFEVEGQQRCYSLDDAPN